MDKPGMQAHSGRWFTRLEAVVDGEVRARMYFIDSVNGVVAEGELRFDSMNIAIQLAPMISGQVTQKLPTLLAPRGPRDGI